MQRAPSCAPLIARPAASRHGRRYRATGPAPRWDGAAAARHAPVPESSKADSELFIHFYLHYSIGYETSPYRVCRGCLASKLWIFAVEPQRFSVVFHGAAMRSCFPVFHKSLAGKIRYRFHVPFPLSLDMASKALYPLHSQGGKRRYPQHKAIGKIGRFLLHRCIAADAVQHDQHRPPAAAGVEADIDAAARQRRIPARRSGGTGISHELLNLGIDRHPNRRPVPGPRPSLHHPGWESASGNARQFASVRQTRTEHAGAGLAGAAGFAYPRGVPARFRGRQPAPPEACP